MGKLSERLVAILYLARGYRVVYRNWVVRGGELDLVLRKGSLWIVVEVRSRRIGAMVSPPASLTQRKRRILKRTIAVCQQRHSREMLDWRFDLVSVQWWGFVPVVQFSEGLGLSGD